MSRRRRYWRPIRRRSFRWARRWGLIAGGISGVYLLVSGLGEFIFPERFEGMLGDQWVIGVIFLLLLGSAIGASAVAGAATVLDHLESFM